MSYFENISPLYGGNDIRYAKKFDRNYADIWAKFMSEIYERNWGVGGSNSGIDQAAVAHPALEALPAFCSDLGDSLHAI